MSFQDTERVIAMPPDHLELLPILLEQYGEELADGGTLVNTLMAHWDDEEHTRKRAASMPTTVSVLRLDDGRIAMRGLWQSDLAAAYDAGQLDAEIQEITLEYLQTHAVHPTI